VKVNVKEFSFNKPMTASKKKTVKKTKITKQEEADSGSEERDDEDEEEIVETTIIKKKTIKKGSKGKKKKGKKESLEIEEEDVDYVEIDGIYGMGSDFVISSAKPKPMMCTTWNGNKIKTFDGLMYNAPLFCSHTLLQDRISGIYSVILKSCPSDAPETCSPSIIVLINGEKYSITKDQKVVVVVAKNKTMNLPVQITGFRVIKTSNGVRISLDTIQLKIVWDTRKMVQIEAPVTLWDKTLGLCGTMDGNVTNDFLDRNGALIKLPNTFVDSWKVDSLNDATDNCDFDGENILESIKCSGNLENEARDTCDNLLSNPKLLNCFEKYSRSALLRACMADYCGCSTDDRTGCACQGVSILAKDCKFRGVAIDNEWRDMVLCRKFVKNKFTVQDIPTISNNFQP
jgi:integrin beta 3